MPQLDEHEFATLLTEAHPRLWTLATAILGDRSQAEDVVQDASITGLRRIADFEPGTSFTAWMSQIVRFTALNHLKTKKNRKFLSLEAHSVGEAPEKAGSQPESVTSSGELMPGQQAFDDRVTDAIQGLDADRRACLLLRIVQGLSYEEIAETVGIPAGTAMSHVHRAKASLRATLSKNGNETTSASSEKPIP